MICTEISQEELLELLSRQLGNNFMLDPAIEQPILHNTLETALERTGFCFKHCENKYYTRDGEPYFNPFHSGQYSIFLYFLSNTVWRDTGNSLLADKIYYLNKMLNALDLFYEVAMPDIFFLDHPVGTVLGRAKYGNYFTFSQNCTVGNNKGIFPTFAEHVTLHSGAKVIGDSTIGNNTVVAANTYIKDTDIPDGSLVFGHSPNLIIKDAR